MEREKFKSRLGFLLISAGCAIGIGNVWRFPYVAGVYGGGAFVLFYIFFLLLLGVPVLTMEFAVGRAGRKSIVGAFHVLEKRGQKWHFHGYVAMAGNYLLMMFYTTVAGWMVYYFYSMITGKLINQDVNGVSAYFEGMLSDPWLMIFWMILVVIIGFGICSMGLQKGVERITKGMMIALLLIMVLLAVNSMLLEGASEGISFYLIPDFERMLDIGVGETIVQAMNQAFFTLSLGIGSMEIFGSYLSKDNTLLGESVYIAILDTFVAFVAGLIIFPACFAYGVSPGSGPSLIFLTLPNIFREMPGGQLWGGLFFLFMSFAALSTLIAVFENILSFGMDLFGWSRRKAAGINLAGLIVLSVPCVLGFNVWSGFAPFGEGTTVLDLEDFMVSNLLLPIGSIVFLLFCVSRYGWGWENTLKEVNTGRGLKLPKAARIYLCWFLPIVIAALLIQGLMSYF